MLINRTIQAAVWIALLAAAAAGCGTATEVSQDRQSADQLRATDALGTRVVEAIAGNGEGREAIAFRDWRNLNEPTIVCMAKAGINWHPAYTPLWQGYESPGVTSEWLGPLQTRLASNDLVSQVKAARAEVDPGEEQDERSQRALSECSQRSYDAAMSEPTENDLNLGQVRHQELADSLTAGYTRLLTDVESQLGPIDKYATCMQDRGIDVTGGTARGFDALYIKLISMAPPVSERPVDGSGNSPTWMKYLDEESRALDADEICRAGQYYEGMAVLAPRLEAFVKAHQADIKILEADWSALVTQANEDGLRNFITD